MSFSDRYPSRRDAVTGAAAVAAAGAAADIQPAFDVLDADRDGKISRDDLKAFYSSFVASSPSEDDINSMISAADADCNGFVDFDEFQRVLGHRSAIGGAGSVMDEAFRVMDRDGDGKVGFEDLKAFLGWAGIPAGDEEIRAMIRMGGGDAADGVRFDAFAKIVAVDSPTPGIESNATARGS